jgi:hypothetical protein
VDVVGIVDLMLRFLLQDLSLSIDRSLAYNVSRSPAYGTPGVARFEETSSNDNRRNSINTAVR